MDTAIFALFLSCLSAGQDPIGKGLAAIVIKIEIERGSE
jgi:hypothetical protein